MKGVVTFPGVCVALLGTAAAAASATGNCSDYMDYSQQLHGPFSSGAYSLASQRPPAACRTFRDSAVDDLVDSYGNIIKDPDLSRLFQNAFPNTLDTAIKWRGFAADNPEEELCFIITGDINAMWLRDSSNQLQTYRSVLKSANDPLASLFRGVINLQARYIRTFPYCNAFQPPVEAPFNVTPNDATYIVTPEYDELAVWTCNFELDSLAAFFQISQDYLDATGDVDFFSKFHWVEAVETILSLAEDMMEPTYGDDGSVNNATYTFQAETMSFEGSLGNNGLGNPVERVGLIKSPFRPSDDACIYQFLVPSNMMFARYLALGSKIASRIPSAPAGLAGRMARMSADLRSAIDAHAITRSPIDGSPVYSFEVDGFGNHNLMDDANIPSLLSMPFFGYVDEKDSVYQNTRRFVLSRKNPWYIRGPVIEAVGGPHIQPGYAWPMASIARIFTSNDDAEITHELKHLVSSTDGLGLIHESINTFNQSDWTRQWFSWANGLFGQMIIDLHDRKPHILQQSFQP